MNGTVHRLHFRLTLDAYAEARERPGGAWEGTVNDTGIRVESDSADGALRKANAAYVRAAADKIERGEAL